MRKLPKEPQKEISRQVTRAVKLESYRQSSCVGKVKIMDETSAKGRIYEDIVYGKKVPRSYYKCQFCGFFHLTTRVNIKS